MSGSMKNRISVYWPCCIFCLKPTRCSLRKSNNQNFPGEGDSPTLLCAYAQNLPPLKSPLANILKCNPDAHERVNYHLCRYDQLGCPYGILKQCDWSNVHLLVIVDDRIEHKFSLSSLKHFLITRFVIKLGQKKFQAI